MSGFYQSQALLPIGMEDLLPRKSNTEAYISELLLTSFYSYGYEPVKTPLLEYAETLLNGHKLMERSFRMIDPLSHKMLSIRPDITLQIARIASSRMRQAPRPLRLCYRGQILRVEGSHIEPERQFEQIGLELIGAPQDQAAIEVLDIAIQAVGSLGMEDLSIDITCPMIVSSLLKDVALSKEDSQNLLEALNEKDVPKIEEFQEQLGTERTKQFIKFVEIAGQGTKAYEVLKSYSYPKELQQQITMIGMLMEILTQHYPNVQITLDMLENRGFDYYSGIKFTLYDRQQALQIGRGGYYQVLKTCEDAMGFTFYMNNLLRIVKPPKAKKRIYVPFEEPRAHGKEWRQKGWVTVQGLQKISDNQQEAMRLNCDYYAHQGMLRAIDYDENAVSTPNIIDDHQDNKKTVIYKPEQKGKV